MKRILALILSLILCFGFIVSCGKEEEAPMNEMSSSKTETIKISFEDYLQGEEWSNIPIFNQENDYYEVVFSYASNNPVLYDNILIKNQNELVASIGEDNIPSKFNASIFDTNYVCAISLDFPVVVCLENVRGFYDFEVNAQGASANVDIVIDGEFLDQKASFLTYYIVLPKSLFAQVDVNFESVNVSKYVYRNE